MIDLAVKRNRDSWEFSIDRSDLRGNFAIHVLDQGGTSLLTLPLREHLDGFSRFAHLTTAGMSWQQQILSYFIELGQTYLVIRPWWGSRLVVSLDDLMPVADKNVDHELTQFERSVVIAELKKISSELHAGKSPAEDRSTKTVKFTLDSCLYLPGVLDLVETIPTLQELEKHCFIQGSRSEETAIPEVELKLCCGRRFVQNSLRRLGVKPRYPTYVVVDEESGYAELNCKDRRESQLVFDIRRDAAVREIFMRLGTPDYIERGGERFDGQKYVRWMLRYEIDAESPYTLLIYLNRDRDQAVRCVKYSPPFWVGPDLFPAEHSLIKHDGGTVISFIDDLENGTFAGEITEL
ncbi:hypothetical protein FYK55_28325 [Roseiconus nitratireducens]|uniref:Uncharacterized protein n=1 Tax=Roseiconus nitratireducens TaxID=2605748 RepID=A0A5M6CKN5_9BACT|nr:hypothetical protein [Roseiconus nitratireducens]KAA5535694.1 hypothetical protein FYK55_28325 [Roseiconus nitratireducens]